MLLFAGGSQSLLSGTEVAGEKKKAERLAARADTTQLAAQIDEMQVLSKRTRFRTRIGFARRRFPPTHL